VWGLGFTVRYLGIEVKVKINGFGFWGFGFKV
jgi:hypothetical protein